MTHQSGSTVVWALLASMLAVGGCSSAQRMAPHMSFGNLDIEAQLNRTDLTILDAVEGESSTLFVLLGLIQVIDDDKLQLLGIKFFKDNYVCLWPWGANTATRAYYKALDASPDADAVFNKSWEREDGGFPLVWFKETVRFKGKAVKLRPDYKNRSGSSLPAYRPEPTRNKWGQLEPGMSPDAVRKTLGQPADVAQAYSAEVWYFPGETGGYVTFYKDRVRSWRSQTSRPRLAGAGGTTVVAAAAP